MSTNRHPRSEHIRRARLAKADAWARAVVDLLRPGSAADWRATIAALTRLGAADWYLLAGVEQAQAHDGTPRLNAPSAETVRLIVARLGDLGMSAIHTQRT